MRALRLAVVLLIAPFAVHAAIPSSERDALVAIYEATGGSSWTNRTRWMDAAGTECSWFGVQCGNDGTTVVELDLSDNNLAGAIPEKIGALPNLRFLNLASNALTGSLPAGIGSLANLEGLIVSRNRLSGAVPSAIGSLRKLLVLALGENLFESVPPEIGQLTLLEELYLDMNRLTSLPKEIGSLGNLDVLNVAGNRIEGPIPKELSSLAGLRYLYLHENEFSGSIPPELRSMVSLRQLYASYNDLSGSIPKELGEMTQLEELDLAANRLSGPIPNELGNLANLTLLSLYGNALTESIPADLFRLGALEHLLLGSNSLSGQIPGGIGGLRSLRFLVIENNQLEGSIPKEIGSITPLEGLWLGDNKLSGSIPAELMTLPNLRGLGLGGNSLSGSIPPAIGNLTKLEELYLYHDDLTGSIPRELGQLRNLQVLYLNGNHLEGGIPDELSSLTNLTTLNLGDNRLSGPIPEWIGNLVLLRELVLGANQLSGPLPVSITRLTALETFELGQNRLTGALPSDIGSLRNLQYLSLGANFFEGEIPASLWTLTNLIDLRLDGLDLAGTLPKEVGNLSRLEVLDLGDMNLSGTIPAEIGNLAALEYLSLDVNKFTGTIPREIGRLSKLLSLDLSLNAISGPIPGEIMQLTSLEKGGSDFDYNALYTSDPAIATFVDAKQYDGEFRGSQTVTPSDLRVVSTTDRSMIAAWTPIAFVDGDGGYRLTVTDGSSTITTTTASKEVDSAIVRGLKASTAYSVRIAALSYPNGWQKNLVVSPDSAAATGTTGVAVLAPADVAITEPARGLIQINEVPANEDSFTVTNFGDAATSLSVGSDGGFFTVEPAAFTLAGGASQTLKVKSVPKPVGAYWGWVWLEGEGVPEDLGMSIYLLSVTRPSGSVVAEAVTARIEVTGEPGTESVGSARFRNTGTASLSGVVVSDVPWLVPAAEQLTIGPAETGAVSFTVRRALRPAAEGALTGTLTLVYVDGGSGTESATKDALDGTTGVSRTLVTVVDIPKPKVTASAIPPLATGEVAFFAPGIATVPGVSRSLVSDIGIANAYGTKAVDDLKVYYAKVGSTAVSVATIPAVAADTAFTLANVIPNVYGATGAETGTLQLRSSALDSLVVSGRLLNLAAAGGGLIGEMPILRSDRAARAADTILLTGIAKSGSASTDVYLVETSGAAATARIEMLDAGGAVLGAAREVPVPAFGTVQLSDAAPQGAVTCAITGAGAGRIAGYARVTESGGEGSAIVDWSRNQQKVFRAATLRVPWVASAKGQSGSGRKRLVRRGSTGSNAADATSRSVATELWLHNPGTTDAVVELSLIDAGGTRRTIEAALAGRATKSWSDVVATIAGGSASGSLEIAPRRGSVVATARLRIGDACGSCGAMLPIVPAGSGLRTGQLQRFAGIEGASSSTVAARKPGTFRTGFGIVETSGSAVKVRASVKLSDGRSPLATILARDFTLGAGAAVTYDDLASTLYGTARGDADLHDLQVDFEVVDGSGAALVWIASTDNATGDAIVRVE